MGIARGIPMLATAAVLGSALAGVGLAQAIEVKDPGLVPYVIKDNAIAASLTGHPGDPKLGLKVAVDRGLGNCLSCHSLPIKDEEFPGNVGPDLAGVGSRLSVGELRLRLVDAKRVNPATSMPGFYKVSGLSDVDKKHLGKPMLSAEQIEDVVADLASLKN